MKNKILDRLAMLLGVIFILAVITLPVSSLHWIWTENELAKKIAMTSSSIVALYIIVIYIKNN